MAEQEAQQKNDHERDLRFEVGELGTEVKDAPASVASAIRSFTAAGP